MTQKTLAQAVADNPFADFQTWWAMGSDFIRFMSEAIVSEWRALPHNSGDLTNVREYVALYHTTVYQRDVADGLVDDFVAQAAERQFQSGEFDALSYAFYRASFELIAAYPADFADSVVAERRRYTERVGATFFQHVHETLQLALPTTLTTDSDFAQLNTQIQKVGEFLSAQGYLRDHFAFIFDVDVPRGDEQITQGAADFLPQLGENNLGYALYEMGYPVILPSAVYLYNTMGEAQHHSSRTIEELFQRVGYDAAEVDDFDPTDYPSDMVVELWEIRTATSHP